MHFPDICIHLLTPLHSYTVIRTEITKYWVRSISLKRWCTNSILNSNILNLVNSCLVHNIPCWFELSTVSNLANLCCVGEVTKAVTTQWLWWHVLLSGLLTVKRQRMWSQQPIITAEEAYHKLLPVQNVLHHKDYQHGAGAHPSQ